MLTNLNLTDMETGYKVFRKEVLDQIAIEEDRFGIEPELTAKIAQLRLRIYEVGIGYNGRTYQQGKKITWKDGASAIWTTAKYWLETRNRRTRNSTVDAQEGREVSLRESGHHSNQLSEI